MATSNWLELWRRKKNSFIEIGASIYIQLKVTAERKRLGLNSNEKKRIGTDSARDASTLNTIKQFRAQNKKHTKR